MRHLPNAEVAIKPLADFDSSRPMLRPESITAVVLRESLCFLRRWELDVCQLVCAHLCSVIEEWSTRCAADSDPLLPAVYYRDSLDIEMVYGADGNNNTLGLTDRHGYQEWQSDRMLGRILTHGWRRSGVDGSETIDYYPCFFEMVCPLLARVDPRAAPDPEAWARREKALNSKYWRESPRRHILASDEEALFANLCACLRHSRVSCLSLFNLVLTPALLHAVARLFDVLRLAPFGVLSINSCSFALVSLESTVALLNEFVLFTELRVEEPVSRLNTSTFHTLLSTNTFKRAVFFTWEFYGRIHPHPRVEEHVRSAVSSWRLVDFLFDNYERYARSGVAGERLQARCAFASAFNQIYGSAEIIVGRFLERFETLSAQALTLLRPRWRSDGFGVSFGLLPEIEINIGRVEAILDAHSAEILRRAERKRNTTETVQGGEGGLLYEYRVPKNAAGTALRVRVFITDAEHQRRWWTGDSRRLYPPGWEFPWVGKYNSVSFCFLYDPLTCSVSNNSAAE